MDKHTVDGVVMTPARMKVRDALVLRKLAEVLDEAERLSPSRAAQWAIQVREIAERLAPTVDEGIVTSPRGRRVRGGAL